MNLQHIHFMCCTLLPLLQMFNVFINGPKSVFTQPIKEKVTELSGKLPNLATQFGTEVTIFGLARSNIAPI